MPTYYSGYQFCYSVLPQLSWPGTAEVYDPTAAVIWSVPLRLLSGLPPNKLRANTPRGHLSASEEHLHATQEGAHDRSNDSPSRLYG